MIKFTLKKPVLQLKEQVDEDMEIDNNGVSETWYVKWINEGKCYRGEKEESKAAPLELGKTTTNLEASGAQLRRGKNEGEKINNNCFRDQNQNLHHLQSL
jgi:hypothetical protein